MSVLQTSVKNKKSYQLTGYLNGAGSYITWTGTAAENIDPVANIPYSGVYYAYYGSLAGLASLFGSTTWSNPTLQGLGAPNKTSGLAVWAGQLNTTATETIAYTFSSAVPAGASFMLLDPGASYPEYTGTETYKVSATYNGAAVSTSGWTFSIQSPTSGTVYASGLTIDAATGTITVGSYALSAWPDAVIVIASNAPVTGISVTANTIPYDFWALTLPHIPSALLFQYGNTSAATAGTIAAWQLNGSAINGGGGIGDPGPSWYYEGSGDFQGLGGTGILFRNENGFLAYWTVSGTTIVNVATLGGPGGTWSVAGVGDFNADGHSDILFVDLAGDLATWQMSGGAIVGGGNLGNPGPSWRFLMTADFNGDGASDILFQNANGFLAEWLISGTSITGVVTLAAAPTGTVYAGVGDFNGDGIADILFRNPATGQYSAWLLTNAGTIASTVTLCTPGVGSALVSIGAYTVSSASDLIFENTSTGMLTDYVFNAGKLTAVGDIGSPGPFYWAARAPATTPSLPPTVFFTDSAGTLATWSVTYGAIQSVSIFSGALNGQTFLAGGDFFGYGRADYLTVDGSGNYSVWDTSGGQIVGGGSLGGPGANWTYKGVGDFNGDGIEDLLFADASGNYGAWLLNGADVIGGGGPMGNPGAGYTLAAIADVSGKGSSDLIFKDASGNYSIWFYTNDVLVNTGYLGSPGAGYTLLGTGDFNGDGRADLIFQGADGSFKTWDLNGGAIVGGGTLAAAGAGWAYVGIAELNGNGCASLLFRNTATGVLVADNLFDTTLVSISTIGSPGAGWTPLTVI